MINNLWVNRTVPLIFEKFNEGYRDFAKMIHGELVIN